MLISSRTRGDNMEYTGRLRAIAKPFVKNTSKNHYVYTISCVLVVILLQLWAYERKPEWILFKCNGTAGGNYPSSQYFENTNENNWLVTSDEYDISAKCVPNNKLELTAAEAQCLRKALLDKFAQRQSSLNIQEHNARNNIRLLDFLVAVLHQNCSNQEGKTDKEALEHDAEVLKFKLKDLEGKLQKSVTFLPLKDTRFAGLTDSEHTWFMSTLRVKNEDGKLEFFSFPSDISNDRILCLQGRNAHDGSKNSYGFAWKMQLPINSTLLPGLTFVSDNYYDYTNPWHSLTALAGFANWYKENECSSPERFVLYHRGELVKTMGSWVSNIMHASLGRHVEVDSLEYGDGPVCFERAVVMRKGIGHLSLDRRILLLDMIRCKVRKFCNVSGGQRFINGIQVVNLTLLARTGSRSFENVSIVSNVLEKECKKVSGCNFHLVHIANLTFCDQVLSTSFFIYLLIVKLTIFRLIYLPSLTSSKVSST